MPRPRALDRDRLRRPRRADARGAHPVATCGRGSLRPEAIPEETVGAALDTAALPDPDLIIRTSGEVRISNFLLWQATYAEYEFVRLAWPDFSVAELARVVEGFRLRRRRFGDIEPAPAASRL